MSDQYLGVILESAHDDGKLAQRVSIGSLSGGADSYRGRHEVPAKLTLVVDTFGVDGQLTSNHVGEYVCAGVRPPSWLGAGPFNFCLALTLLLSGQKLSRKGIASNIKFVYLVPGSTFNVNRPPLMGIYPDGHAINYRPHLDAAYFDGTCGVWTLTQEDVMSEDWYMVDVDGQVLGL